MEPAGEPAPTCRSRLPPHLSGFGPEASFFTTVFRVAVTGIAGTRIEEAEALYMGVAFKFIAMVRFVYLVR